MVVSVFNDRFNESVGAILHFLGYEAGHPVAMDLKTRVVAAIAVSTGRRSIDDSSTNPTAAYHPLMMQLQLLLGDLWRQTAAQVPKKEQTRTVSLNGKLNETIIFFLTRERDARIWMGSESICS